METLAIFILGVTIITLLARYNESNKLFWTLFTCFTLGVVAAKLSQDIFGKKESNTSVVTAQPTQALAATSSTFSYLLTGDLLPTSVKVTSKPVGKAIVLNNDNITLSSVSGVTEGLFVNILPNPPTSVEIVDDS